MISPLTYLHRVWQYLCLWRISGYLTPSERQSFFRWNNPHLGIGLFAANMRRAQMRAYDKTLRRNTLLPHHGVDPKNAVKDLRAWHRFFLFGKNLPSKWAWRKKS